MSTTLIVRGFEQGLYSVYYIVIYIVRVFVFIGNKLCTWLYDIIKYAFETETNLVCVMLSITILASIIDDIFVHMYQYEQLNANKKRIYSLEKRLYYTENKLDDTRTILLTLQSDFDYYKTRKERMRLG